MPKSRAEDSCGADKGRPGGDARSAREPEDPPDPPAITAMDVHAALERGELYLEYLPLMAVPEGRCVGAEALTRWRRPDRVIMPDEFIPVVEETPVSGLLTYWVIETVAGELGDWLRAHEGVEVGINVPPEVLGRGGLAYAIERSGLRDQVSKLVMEITERGLPDKLGALALEMVEAYGARIALDDALFEGRNLVVLSRCPFHILKIDRKLVAEIDGSGQPAWLDHLSALRQGASLEIVAEGVETQAQLDTLLAAGVTRVQGFYFSRPLSSADFIAFQGRHS